MVYRKTLNSLLSFIFFVGIFLSCNTKGKGDLRNYKQDMRNLVIGISQFAKAQQTDFIIIPQNGIEIITETGDENAALATAYLNAIDGHGQEDLFYGYNNDNEATPTNESDYIQLFLDRSSVQGNTILVTDYCSTPSKMTNSYSVNETAGYISFAADHRGLDNIPTFPTTIQNENTNLITSLSDAQNFLYLINPENYASKAAFIAAVTATNYDLLIMDLFFNDGTAFTAAEVAQLRQKANGGTRLVISYMSIGEAEDYRYYWKNGWGTGNPSWIRTVNPDWAGNYKVEYWNAEWQQIIFDSPDSYLQKIINAEFDGVYLDIIDAYEFFEQ